MPPLPIEVHPLNPARLADFLAFFEGDAFADNPRWASCYCQFLHVDHAQVDWPARTAEQNRAAACERVACARMQGHLAYREGRVVGWCNAAPRPLMAAFDDEPDADAALIGQIGCFVVAAPHRRSGVARALLNAACNSLRDQGMRWAEACPLTGAQTDAQQHFGPLSLYLAAGFEVHRSAGEGQLVVRRALG